MLLKGTRLQRMRQALVGTDDDAAKERVECWIKQEDDFVARRICAECGQVPNETYMVNDEVWAAADMKKRGFLHLNCLELRLGRNLEIEDFTAWPVNNDIRFGYIMGKRTKEK